MHNNIPAELRALPQWVSVDMSIDDEDGLPKKSPLNPRFTHTPAKVNDRSTWGTFEEATANGRIPGFVLTKEDEYAIIDLDNKPHNPATPAQLEIHNQILEGIDSYIERSISATGYHCVVKGEVPIGINFGNIELYSWGRMMIFTGDVVKDMPIEDYAEAVTNMYEGLNAARERSKPIVEVVLEQQDGHMSDGDIFDMGGSADNGTKFNDLCRGDWQHYNFPSQSEADLALLSMFAFYSKDNEQCRRMFRMTELGKREKYQKDNNHINRLLTICRAKDIQPIDVQAMEDKVAAVKAELAEPASIPKIPERRSPSVPKLPASIRPKVLDALNPPGVLGMMADYIYLVAPRQVREYAVAASLAMLSGIAGRAFNISRTGLNQYIIALGGTGTGKEGMAAGISRLESAINEGITTPTPVVIGKPASAQGLHKSLIAQPCGLSILGEVANEFKIMLSPKVDPNSLAIKTAYLDLYNKSGDKQTYHAINYSKAENNMTAIQSPNLTILGESVPDTFYATINETSARDGFLGRLMIIEYTGLRNDYNDCNEPPPPALVNSLAAIRNHAADLQARQLVEHITMTPEAQEYLVDYDKAVTRRMNEAAEAGRTAVSETLNRSHVKALKLAGLGAVATNFTNPIVTLPLAEWAVAFVEKASAILTTRFESGEVGEASDLQFETVMRKCLNQYFKMEPKTRVNQKQPIILAETNFISYSFISSYCKQREPFKSHKLGHGKAIEMALKEMIDTGVILPVPISQLPKATNGHSMKAYAIGPQF